MSEVVAHRFQSTLRQYPEHAQCLGLIADTCNLIEKVFCEAVAYSMSISDEQAEAIFYSVRNSRSRFDIAERVIDRFTEPQDAKAGLLKQLGIARSLFSRRNMFVHSVWDARRGKTALLDFGKPGNSQARSRPMSLPGLNKLLDELEECLNNTVEASVG